MNRFEALHALVLEEGASDEDITMALYGFEKAAGRFDFSDIPPLTKRIDHWLTAARDAKKFLLNARNRSAARQVESIGAARKGKVRVTALAEKQARLTGLEQLRKQVCIYLGTQQDARRNSIIVLLGCIVVGFVALRYIRLMMARIAVFTALAIVAVVASSVLTRAILTIRKLKTHVLDVDGAIAQYKKDLGIDDEGEEAPAPKALEPAEDAPALDAALETSVADNKEEAR